MIIWIYSAYVDDRLGRFVRIIAEVPLKKAPQLICLFSEPENHEIFQNLQQNEEISLSSSTTFTRQTVSAARIQNIRENWSTQYTAAYLLCPLPDSYSAGRTIVTVLSQWSVNVRPPLPNALRIRSIQIQNGDESDRSLVICVKPLYGEHPDAKELVEFVEYYRVLGANLLAIYVWRTSNETRRVLDYYVSTGFVQTLPWEMQVENLKQIRNVNQLAAYNDCLYRYMASHYYVGIVDPGNCLTLYLDSYTTQKNHGIFTECFES